MFPFFHSASSVQTQTSYPRSSRIPAIDYNPTSPPPRPSPQLTAYFMGLVASGSQQAVVSVVDAAAGGIERLIQQSELNGSPGVKLDVSMDAPVLIMPRNSTSSEYGHPTATPPSRCPPPSLQNKTKKKSGGLAR